MGVGVEVGSVIVVKRGGDCLGAGSAKVIFQDTLCHRNPLYRRIDT